MNPSVSAGVYSVNSLALTRLSHVVTNSLRDTLGGESNGERRAGPTPKQNCEYINTVTSADVMEVVLIVTFCHTDYTKCYWLAMKRGVKQL